MTAIPAAPKHPKRAGTGAAAPSVTDYGEWIWLDIGNASASGDPDSIITSATYDEATGETTIVLAKASLQDPAWWAFEPVDADGNPVDLTKFGISVSILWETQPSAGGNTGIFVGMTEGDALTNWVSFGGVWDTAAKGPDLMYYATGVWSPSAASTADADGTLHLNLPPAYYDAASNRYEPMGGGHAFWMRNPSGDFEVDKVQYNTSSNKTLGTDPDNIRMVLIVTAGAIETIVPRIRYRVYPLIEELS